MQLSAGLSPAPPTTLRVRDLLELYLGAKSELGSVTPTTLSGLKTFAKRTVGVMGEMPVLMLSPKTLAGYIVHRLRTPARRTDQVAALAGKELPRRCAAPSSVQQEINLLRAAWNWGQSMGLVTAGRPFPPVTVPGARGIRRITVNNRTTPTSDDVEAVAAVLARHRAREGGPWLLVAFRLLALTACRVGEVLALTWNQVDFGNRTIHVVGKTGPRTVPLVDAAVEAIRQLATEVPPARDVPLFGVRYARTKFALRLKAACTEAGVEVFSPHGLRRYGVTQLYRSGADPSVAAAISGHSAEVALAYYRQVSAEDLHSAMLNAFPGGEPSERADLHKTCTTSTPRPRKTR